MKVLLYLALMYFSAANSSLERAQLLLSQGSYQKAAAILQQVVLESPTDPLAHQLLGNTLALLGDRRHSIEQLIEAVRLKPDSASANNDLGLALSRFAENSAARAAFEKAVAVDPKLAEARINLGLNFAQAGDSEGALENFNQAIALLGDSPAAAYSHYLKAKLMTQEKAYDKAIAELEVATKLRPDLAAAWAALGQVCRITSNEKRARFAMERAIALDPNDGVTQYQLGLLYLGLGEFHKAVLHLDSALSLHGADKGTVYNLERALRKDGQTAKADRLLTKMKSLRDGNEQVNASTFAAVQLNNEGVTLESEGNLTGAIRKYREALSLSPDHDGFRLNYGLALCRQRRWKDGLIELREVVRRAPDDANANRALQIALDQAKAAGDQP